MASTTSSDWELAVIAICEYTPEGCSRKEEERIFFPTFGGHGLVSDGLNLVCAPDKAATTPLSCMRVFAVACCLAGFEDGDILLHSAYGRQLSLHQRNALKYHSRMKTTSKTHARQF